MMKPTLLLVDDNESLLRLLKSIFDKHFTVFTAGDGVEAIHILSKGIRPCLILCDVQMQNIDGHELVAHLATSHLYRDIPVILLTDIKQAADTLPMGNVVKVVHKPFDPVHLLDTVRGVLAQGINPNRAALRRDTLFASGSFFTISKS
jgi:two-component system, chemotaxis family, chemotaxis protein CheY